MKKSLLLLLCSLFLIIPVIVAQEQQEKAAIVQQAASELSKIIFKDSKIQILDLSDEIKKAQGLVNKGEKGKEAGVDGEDISEKIIDTSMDKIPDGVNVDSIKSFANEANTKARNNDFEQMINKQGAHPGSQLTGAELPSFDQSQLKPDNLSSLVPEGLQLGKLIRVP